MMRLEQGSFLYCWDMDGTLGRFEALEARVKSGVKNLLQDLISSGHINIVTTYASEARARMALRTAGLDRFFTEVFGHDRVSWDKTGDYYHGKLYKTALEAFNFSEEEAARRMLVLGDSPTDQPLDTELVFVHHPFCCTYDATPLRELFDHLPKLGEGDLKRGFDVMFSRSALNRGYYKLGQDVDLCLAVVSNEGYRGSPRSYNIPTIKVNPSDIYKRDLELAA